MSWTVSINLGSGNLQQGCGEITAQVSSEKSVRNLSPRFAAPKPLQIRGSLPPAPEIEQLYRQWKLLYLEFYREQSWHSIREIKIESGGITYFSEVEFYELCQQLTTQLNNWLDVASFHNIDRKLSRILDPAAEIQVIIETNDPILRRLPWHLWNFFEDYPYAELALSTLEYGRAESRSSSGKSARILAIFGNDHNLDLQADRNAIEDLPDATTVFLESPGLQELNEQLWQKIGWDILFFAGHSQTEAETGQIFINQTETITLEQLRNSLKKAISQGLKLAIFNSCDGLGLAQSLADLHIPLVIVMRESVPNKVAQEFFRYFLTAFSQGESLYAAVREARERLESLETKYPCATWLPVICQNPAAELPTWQNLTKFHQSDRALRHRKLRLPILLLASFIATTLVIGLRELGILQLWELATYDQLLNLRPAEAPDPRLLIITVTEEDVQNQPPQERLGTSISDGSLAKLLQKLQFYQPRVIGLDIYREFLLDNGRTDLIEFTQNKDNFITVCEVGTAEQNQLSGTKPFPEISPEQSSFSDFPVDDDGVIRRQLLGMSADPKSICTADIAFSLRVVQTYFEHKGKKVERNLQGDLQIGDLTLKKLDSQAGGYNNVDDKGYQLLLNYRASPIVAETITLTDFISITDQLQLRDLVRDRIVLIGTIAPSFNDYFLTPIHTAQQIKMAGVIIHAHMISQILSAAQDNRPLLTWFPEWAEILIIWSCSIIIGFWFWCFKSFVYRGIASVIIMLLIPGIGYVVFLSGVWFPMVSGLLVAVTTVGTIVSWTALRYKYF
ncbi:CHASE2 domain-containing protein [Pleurocapsa sp. PCC 7319]|uniref:CHASE2 domain-containing protein n=1 Tax=Pleurocapsa sp. PCC 7319 TaxID=118161 RepID=UPI000347A19F|nr:CHASE2 domain-containing protein [Pleurocapsa sp. PCC 7319]